MTSTTATPEALPTLEPLFAPSEDDDLSSHRYRMLIGVLGLMLPILLWVIAGSIPAEGLDPWKPLSSVSAYYYTVGVAAFVGILVALALFLFTYRGYRNKYNRLDRLAAIISGVAAIGVAFFPAGAPPELAKPSWWSPAMGKMHFLCAAVLFGTFIFFSVFLFPKSRIKRRGALASDKWTRNFFYRLFGVAMAVCIILIYIMKLADKPIFWPEAAALEFFAASWLLKGRADWTLASAGRRFLHYGRHAEQLVGKIVRTIRG